MLLLTDSAKLAIESILADAPEPQTAGLRIAASAKDANALALTVTTAPDDGDTVVDEGVRVFLAPVAAAVLDDKVLDTSTSEAGTVQFRVTTQA